VICSYYQKLLAMLVKCFFGNLLLHVSMLVKLILYFFLYRVLLKLILVRVVK